MQNDNTDETLDTTLEDTSTEETTDTGAETSDANGEEATDYKALYEAEKGRRKRAETDLEKAKSKPAEVKTSNSTLSEAEIAKKVKDELVKDKLVEEDGLTDDELKEIEEFALVKKVSLAEAIKSPVIKRLIEDSKEMKRSKEVTSTDNRRAGSNRLSDEQLLTKARADKPLTEEELVRLARM
jgi:hypothetical protein